MSGDGEGSIKGRWKMMDRLKALLPGLVVGVVLTLGAGYGYLYVVGLADRVHLLDLELGSAQRTMLPAGVSSFAELEMQRIEQEAARAPVN